jgi:hypothetical protein
MARVVFDMVKGSSEPIIIQLYPVATDTGTNGIDLTGATSLSASAKHVDTAAVVNFDSAAVYGTPTDGKVRLLYDAADFTALGLYDIQITFTDGAGYVRRYPSEGTGLRMRLNGSNA